MEKTMQSFKVGKTYYVNGGGKIYVTRRTDKYITFIGTFRGRRKIHRNDLFGLGENILIPSEYYHLKFFCFAGHEAV